MYDAADNSSKSYDVAISSLRERLEKSRTVVDGCTLYNEDCRFILPTLHNVDSIVTDPPYHLTSIHKRYSSAESMQTNHPIYKRHARGFMGKGWDGGDIAFDPELWKLCLNALKPGGHLLAFGGTRTYHRMACAIEDAGFEIRDCIAWVYGSGFPKSHNLSDEWDGWGTALKPAFEPIIVARKPLSEKSVAANVRKFGTGALNIDASRVHTGDDLNGGAYAKSGTFRNDGWGMQRGVASDGYQQPSGRWPANFIHDGSEEVVRLFPETKTTGKLTGNEPSVPAKGDCVYGFRDRVSAQHHDDAGTAARFFYCAQWTKDDEWHPLGQEYSPERVNSAEPCLSLQSEAVVSALNDAVARSMPGAALNSASYQAPSTNVTPNELRLISENVIELIRTTARRFWRESQPQRHSLTSNHVSIAAAQEQTDTITITISLSKSNGCADHATFNCTVTNSEVGAKGLKAARFLYTSKADKDDRLKSKHPTVKPIDLMAYLVRLVTQPGGTVLDPFAGSGSTGMACMREGMNCILIEREEEYFADILHRVSHVRGEDTPLFAQVETTAPEKQLDLEESLSNAR
jgi:site-specific DNA-methyltransferase (adenine-specific)